MSNLWLFRTGFRILPKGMFFPVEQQNWGQIFSTKQKDIKVYSVNMSKDFPFKGIVT
jgi:hypothetical protein